MCLRSNAMLAHPMLLLPRVSVKAFAVPSFHLQCGSCFKPGNSRCFGGRKNEIRPRSVRDPQKPGLPRDPQQPTGVHTPMGHMCLDFWAGGTWRAFAMLSENRGGVSTKAKNPLLDLK